MSGTNPHKSLISIGSNLGNRLDFIQNAIEEIKKSSITIVNISKIIETKALEVVEQPDFLNCIIEIETFLEPIALLDQLQIIEKSLGRVKRYAKGPREIDLDILTYDSLNLHSERLTLPHPAIESRPFIKELLVGMKVNLI